MKSSTTSNLTVGPALICVASTASRRIAAAVARILLAAGVPVTQDPCAGGTLLMVPPEFSDLAGQILAKRRKEVEEDEDLDDEDEEEEDEEEDGLEEEDDEDEDEEDFDEDDEEFDEEFDDDELDDDDDDIFYDDDDDE